MDGEVLSLSYDKLAELLQEGCDALFNMEAATRLIVRHGYWLKRREFLRFVVLFKEPTASAGILWADAVEALDRGEMQADDESANILRISASLATFYQVSFRDVCEGISREGIKHVAEAIMYADSFLESVATPA